MSSIALTVAGAVTITLVNGSNTINLAQSENTINLVDDTNTISLTQTENKIDLACSTPSIALTQTENSIALTTTGVLPANIADINALTPTDDNFIVGDGTNWISESGNTARTSLGLGTGDSPTFDDLTIANPVNIYGLSHDDFADFVPNEHINHTSVTLTAGNHLSGGGDISANRTFDVDDDFVLNTGDTMTGVLATAGRVVNTTRVTAAYTVLVTDDSIFCDTDGGVFTLTLPVGVDGQRLFIANCGSGGYDLTVDGNGAEEINGATTILLSDGESVILIFESVEQWRIF